MAQKAVAAKEATFTWQGSDKKGARVKGETTSKSIALVKAELRRQGIKPLSVKKKSTLFSGAKMQKVRAADICVFARQLATMMSSGVPLVQSFEIIINGNEHSGMVKLLAKIKTDVESGSTLSEALEKHPFHFDDLFCNLVKAGEQAGILEELLGKIATYKERTEEIKAKIKKALFYPTAIMAVAFGVSAILLIYVVPQFEELFENFGGALPAFTQAIIDLSRFLQDYWFLVLGALAGVIFSIGQTKKRSPAFRRWLDRAMLKVPIVGSIVNKAAIARFARTMATMFAAGVPLVDSMKSVAGASGNVVYYDAIMRMRDDVSTGRQLQLAMRDTKLFPPMVVQMVAIGEESGNIDGMLSKVADFYEEAVSNDVDSMSSLLEPIIMVVLGGVVGSLVIAMYLPIFKLGAIV